MQSTPPSQQPSANKLTRQVALHVVAFVLLIVCVLGAVHSASSPNAINSTPVPIVSELPANTSVHPVGELALDCKIDGKNDSLMRIRADGTGVIQTLIAQDLSRPAWSSDGKRLAYSQDGHPFVIEVESGQIKAVREQSWCFRMGWLPDGRFHFEEGTTDDNDWITRVVDLSSGIDNQIIGKTLVWSPNGKWLARTVGMHETWQGLLFSDANGQNSYRVASGFRPAWSPDSTRIAFQTDIVQRIPSDFGVRQDLPSGIAVADVASHTVKMLAHMSDLSGDDNADEQLGNWIGGLYWSPDGINLAAAINLHSSKPVLTILNADSGTVLTRWHGTMGAWDKIAWSSDNRHVAFWARASDYRGMTHTVGILDIVTGNIVTLPGWNLDWSPDGKWLAILQEPSGVLLVTPELESRWLDTPHCSSVAWRPTIH